MANNDASNRGRQGSGVTLIARGAYHYSGQAASGLTLLFPAGGRPCAEAVEQALASAASAKRIAARVSSQRAQAEGWVELLASGLTFDLAGLMPGPTLDTPDARHFFGLSRDASAAAFEAVAVFPGPHLADARAMVPVVRTMSMLASTLAIELGAVAVCWEPAGSWMDVQYFSRIVEGWSAGGAFPALGLTGIERTQDGGVESDGLAFFIGQELRVEARRGETAADTVKLAARVIDHLVSHGALETREALMGPTGEALLAEPSSSGQFVQVWRDG